MSKPKNLIKYFLNDLATFFPYIFVFYLISLILSLFLKSWQLFFNWNAFHFGMAFLLVLSALSPKGKSLIKQLQIQRLKFIKNNIFKIYNFLKKQLQKPTKYDYLKFLIIILLVSIAIWKKANILEILILIYGLISILYALKTKIPVILAILCLISCPILLVLKLEVWAEIMAVYSYYLLVIIILTQIITNYKNKANIK